MNEFIKELGRKLDKQIVLSEEIIPYKNTYTKGNEGNITGLSLYNTKLKELDVLRPIADDLLELYLIENAIHDLMQLEHFSKLVKLGLRDSTIANTDVKHLLNLTKLKFLELSETEIRDTSYLGNLNKLEYLHLGSSFHLTEIKGLEKLTNLKVLDCSGSKFLSIQQIDGPEGIDRISVSCSELESMSGIERFPNLKEIDISSTGVTEIKGLESLRELRKLNVSASNLKKISGLDTLENLENLHLGHGELTKIEGLDALINLRRLNLRENEIRKVENLESLVSLEYLGLEMNNIDAIDSTFLSVIRNPCEIYLGGNNIGMQDIGIHPPDHISLHL